MLDREIWRPRDPADAEGLIAQYPLATLVVNGEDGPLAALCPFILDRSRGPKGTLVGHMARSNPVVRGLAEVTRVLVIFQGPNGYVSPSWYPKRDMAPTWYYSAVQARGQVRLYSDAVLLEHWAERITDHLEQVNPDRWRMAELGPEGIARRMHALIGFEVEVEKLISKFKYGQDEPLEDVEAVITRLNTVADESVKDFAQEIKRHNAWRYR